MKRRAYKLDGKKNILQEHGITRGLFGHVRKRKLWNLCRNHGCQITETVVELN